MLHMGKDRAAVLRNVISEEDTHKQYMYTNNCCYNYYTHFNPNDGNILNVISFSVSIQCIIVLTRTQYNSLHTINNDNNNNDLIIYY